MKLYLIGKNVVKEEQKQALLLHMAGFGVQEIYYTLAGTQDKTYTETLTILENHFVPQTNVPFERHLFRQLHQDVVETVDQFVCRLRQRSGSCDFGATEDEQVRDQLIDKCHSTHWRRKFLEKEGRTHIG